MQKWVVSVFLVIGIAAVGYAGEIPIEKENFGNNYANDSTAVKFDKFSADKRMRQENADGIDTNEIVEPREAESGILELIVETGTSSRRFRTGDK